MGFDKDIRDKEIDKLTEEELRDIHEDMDYFLDVFKERFNEDGTEILRLYLKAFGEYPPKVPGIENYLRKRYIITNKEKTFRQLVNITGACEKTIKKWLEEEGFSKPRRLSYNDRVRTNFPDLEE